MSKILIKYFNMVATFLCQTCIHNITDGELWAYGWWMGVDEGECGGSMKDDEITDGR